MISWASFGAFWHFFERSRPLTLAPSLVFCLALSSDWKVSLFESGTTVPVQFKSFDNHSRKLCAVCVKCSILPYPHRHGWMGNRTWPSPKISIPRGPAPSFDIVLPNRHQPKFCPFTAELAASPIPGSESRWTPAPAPIRVPPKSLKGWMLLLAARRFSICRCALYFRLACLVLIGVSRQQSVSLMCVRCASTA